MTLWPVGTDGQVNKRMNRYMNGRQIDRQTNGQLNGPMDGWMDGKTPHSTAACPLSEPLLKILSLDVIQMEIILK